MIGNSLISQIGVAGIAIAIIITYIKPTITDIGVLQDQIDQTVKELDKVIEVKKKLEALTSQVEAISPKDKQALSNYLPEFFDEVIVLKDLEAITKLSGVNVKSLSYGGESAIIDTETEANEGAVKKPTGHTFALDISSSYEEMKYLLLLLERNKYPLDIQNLSLTPTDGGLLGTSLEVRTYSYK